LEIAMLNRSALTAVVIASSSFAFSLAFGVTARPAHATSMPSLYVLNQGQPSIEEFSAFRSGNVAPLRVIAGGHTEMSKPTAFAIDDAGYIYVAERRLREILVFSPDARGDASPTAVLRGPKTDINDPTAISISGNGRIGLADANGRVLVFSPGAYGDVAPAEIIGGPETGLKHPSGVGFDRFGRLFVADRATNAISTFVGSYGGNVLPFETLKGQQTLLTSPVGLTVDPPGRLYVSNANGSVLVFRFDSTGDASPTIAIAGGKSTISDPGTPAYDAATCVYVPLPLSNALDVFYPGVTGNVAPNMVIRGSNTKLSRPIAIALH
jgi:hypothetical protein